MDALLQCAKSPVTALVFIDRFEQVALPEVGPEFFDDHHLVTIRLPRGIDQSKECHRLIHELSNP
jgi:hypothetical protein